MAAGTTARRRLVRALTRRSVSRTLARRAVVDIVDRLLSAVVGIAAVLVGVVVAVRVSPWLAAAAVAFWVAAPVLADWVGTWWRLWERAGRVAALRRASVIDTAGRAWPVAGVTGPQIRPTGEGRDGGAR